MKKYSIACATENQLYWWIEHLRGYGLTSADFKHRIVRFEDNSDCIYDLARWARLDGLVICEEE